MRVLWWVVTGLVFAGWVVMVTDTHWGCYLRDPEHVLARCDKLDAVRYASITFKVNAALDVVTDVLGK